MKRKVPYFAACSFIWFMLFITASVRAEGKDTLDCKIILLKTKGTIYQMLGEITERSGFLFIYDSNILDNDQRIKLKKKEYTIREAVHAITGQNDLKMKIIGNHILLSLHQKTDSAANVIDQPLAGHKESIYFDVEGVLHDNYTQEPISYGTVGVKEAGVGTITNQNGEFRLRLPDSLLHSTIYFSHLGYKPQEINSQLLIGRHNFLTLEPQVIPIQEIVVRLVNPRKLLQDMIDKRNINYANHPAYLTSFYREGVEHRKKLSNLTEAIFKIYKTPYMSPHKDQVKLLKMRRISDENEKDSLIAKMKSGINACLLLDVIKILPDFFMTDYNDQYNYIHSDITVIDNRLANVISFEQKANVKEPLYKGAIYIDAENDALLRVSFEFNPQYVKDVGNILIIKKSRDIKIIPQKVSYTVTYKPWNNTYYINHIRGDLNFKIKKRRKIFNTNTLHVWFEMATCRIDTIDVRRFTKHEILPTRSIFAETNFIYDKDFWENFNVILPEEKLNEAISKISSKIEETGY
ncbi:STN and carboxypeptidase regulatory-like domain-containing protein [Parabacteroides bouchesdurhonensis]|uniref:STN and carboxypeptidase regulatory-like domain-containing protein n=1 Tax=Parabacteroides bouchesdurhonensis TaxID=1936995 RepID=UPI0026BD31A8